MVLLSDAPALCRADTPVGSKLRAVGAGCCEAHRKWLVLPVTKGLTTPVIRVAIDEADPI
jgi:hypothetical protein